MEDYFGYKFAKNQHYKHQWKICMTKNQRFDYLMSIWLRKYYSVDDGYICVDIENL